MKNYILGFMVGEGELPTRTDVPDMASMEGMLDGMKESWRCASAVEYDAKVFQELDKRAKSINRRGGFGAIRIFDKLLVFRDWPTAAADKDLLEHISSFSFLLDGQKVDMLEIFQFEPGCSRRGDLLTFVPRWGTLPPQLVQHEAKRIKETYNVEAVARSSKLLMSRPSDICFFKGYSLELPGGLLLKPGYDESGDLLEFSYPSNLLEPNEAGERIGATAERLSESGIGRGSLDFVPVGPSLYVASDPQNNWVYRNWMSMNHQLECWCSRKRVKTARYIVLRSTLFKFVPNQDKLFLSHGYVVDEAQALEAARGEEIPVGIRPLCIVHDMSHDACTRREKQTKMEELTAQVSRGWAQMAAIITPSGVVTNVRSGGVICETEGYIDLSPVLPGCSIYLEDIEPHRETDIMSLLCDAVEDCNFDLVKRCTARLPTLNSQDRHDRVPLVVAAKKGYVDIVVYLMEQGASVQVEDGDGVSPLIAATIEGNSNLMKVFEDAGATCDYGGAIFLARGRGKDYVVKGLEAAGHTCPIPFLGF